MCTNRAFSGSRRDLRKCVLDNKSEFCDLGRFNHILDIELTVGLLRQIGEVRQPLPLVHSGSSFPLPPVERRGGYRLAHCAAGSPR